VAAATYALSLGKDFWLAKWTSQSASVSDPSFVLFYGGLTLGSSILLFGKEVCFCYLSFLLLLFLFLLPLLFLFVLFL